MNTVLDVMKRFGFALTENPKISEGAFSATIPFQGKAYLTAEKVKKVLAVFFEGLSQVLKKGNLHVDLTPQQARALDNLIRVFHSISSQVIVQIDNFVVNQSYQQNKAVIRIHHISEDSLE